MKFILWTLALNWIYPQFYSYQFSRWSRRLDKSQKYQGFSNQNIQFMKAPKNLSPESKTVSSTRLLDLSNKSVNNGVAVNFTLSQKTFDESFILIKNTVNSCCSLLFHLCQETLTKIWPFLQDFFNSLKIQHILRFMTCHNNWPGYYQLPFDQGIFQWRHLPKLRQQHRLYQIQVVRENGRPWQVDICGVTLRPIFLDRSRFESTISLISHDSNLSKFDRQPSFKL